MAWKFKYKGRWRLAYHPYQVPHNAKGVKKVNASKFKNLRPSKYGFIIK